MTDNSMILVCLFILWLWYAYEEPFIGRNLAMKGRRVKRWPQRWWNDSTSQGHRGHRRKPSATLTQPLKPDQLTNWAWVTQCQSGPAYFTTIITFYDSLVSIHLFIHQFFQLSLWQRYRLFFFANAIGLAPARWASSGSARPRTGKLHMKNILAVFVVSHDHHRPYNPWASTVRSISESEATHLSHPWAQAYPIPSHLTRWTWQELK